MRLAGQHGSWPLACGLVVLAGVWIGPLPEWSRHSFAAHMAMHMSVVAVAAPLIAAGMAGGRLDPVRWLATGASPTNGRPMARRVAAVLLSPVVASVVEFIVVWAWHAPALHHAARHSTGLLVVEQGSFLAVGLLVWLAAFGGSAAQRHLRAATGIAGLLLTSMHMTLLGVLLALATRPLYGHGADVGFGLTALQDQHLGGVLMLSFGGVAYLAGALVLLFGLLRERHAEVADG
ncbi:cytochrome c oxidase assembly protein [Lysobacter sp. F6437]|uniref:cytochrome c oxidase assembly protein n=1 Tax=Lysobacter sp. F6437 TaxID=3459296 RepID=UPI00403D8AA7